MTRVKAFSGKHLFTVQKEINKWVEEDEVKIISVSISDSSNIRVLVVYEK